MDANLQADFQTIDAFLRKMLELIEALNTRDGRGKLAEELLRYYKGDGELQYNVVPKEYADEVLKALQGHKIPFMSSPTTAGDVMMILPKEGDKGYNYQDILENVFMHHPEYYRQLDRDTFLRLARADGVKKFVKFQFDNAMDAEIFKNKAFADRNGIVTMDMTEKDGSVTVYCREEDFITHGRHSDAVSALIETEYSLRPEYQSAARRYAVYHDNEQVDLCMQKIRNEEDFVIHDYSNNQNDYIEFSNNQLTYWSWDGEMGKFVNSRPVNITLNDKTEESVRKLLDYHVSKIHNEKVSSVTDFKRFLQKDNNAVMQQYLDKQVELYTKYLLPVQRKKVRVKDENGDFIQKRDENGNPVFKTNANGTLEPVYETRDCTAQEKLDALKGMAGEMKSRGLDDIRPAFDTEFLEIVKNNMQAEVSALKAEMSEVEAPYRDKVKSVKSDIAEIYKGIQGMLIKDGITQVYGESIEKCRIEDLADYLNSHRDAFRDELKGRAEQIFGNVPLSSFDAFIQAYVDDGNLLSDPERAAYLMQKVNPTVEETEEMFAMMEECEFVLMAKEDRGIEDILKKYQSLNTKAELVNRFIDTSNKKIKDVKKEGMQVEKKKDTLKAKIITKEKNVRNMEHAIETEQKGKSEIKKLDKECHAYIASLRKENPSMSIGELRKTVSEFLKDNGFENTVAKIHTVDSVKVDEEVYKEKADVNFEAEYDEQMMDY